MANLQTQAGLALNGSSSPASGVGEMNPASGLSLAALANFSNPGIFSSLGKWHPVVNVASFPVRVFLLSSLLLKRTFLLADINAMNMQNLAALAAIAGNGNGALSSLGSGKRAI